MSQSQQSDFTSSQFSTDLDLAYLTPSNQPATPSDSQRTFDAYGPSFIRPAVPPLIANLERFERVGPDRKKLYFLYDIMNHSEWVNWWLQTDFRSKSKITWDLKHLSRIWDHFEQVAHTVNSSPKVIYKRCSAILKHPYVVKGDVNVKDARHGTTTMSRHIKTSGCQRAAGIR